MNYQIIANGAVLSFALSGSASERRRMTWALRALATEPTGVDDEEVRLASGRIYKARLFQGLRLIYATDHVRREVEIINIEPSSPWRRV